MCVRRDKLRTQSLLRWSSRICRLAGIAVLGCYVCLSAEGYFYQASQSGLFRPSQENASVPDQSKCHVSEPNTGAAIGRIEISRLGLSVVVLEGDDEGVLRLGAGRIPGTAHFGEAGNIGIAAHRDTFFRPLRNVRHGDIIVLNTDTGSYQYRVETLKIVAPIDVEVLASTSEPTLTLVTCYPFYYVGSAPDRFIVRAREISSDSRAVPSSCFSSPASE